MVSAIGFVVPWLRKSIAVFATVFLLLARLCLHADSVPTGTIDLRQPANLKMLFDGGLRPYRLQGLESSQCDIDRNVLTIILPNASPFNFEVDRADFSILAENEIAAMDLYGVYTPLSDAVNLTKTICHSWGVSLDGFDQAIQNLGTKPGTSEGWGQKFIQPNIRAQVIFKPLYSIDHVGGYVIIALRCGDHFHGMKFLTGPIQPPPGYENVSMDPPPIKPSGRALPGMTLDQAREQVQKRIDEMNNTTSQQSSALSVLSPPNSPAEHETASPDNKTNWIVITVILLVIILSCFGLWKFMRK